MFVWRKKLYPWEHKRKLQFQLFIIPYHTSIRFVFLALFVFTVASYLTSTQTKCRYGHVTTIISPCSLFNMKNCLTLLCKCVCIYGVCSAAWRGMHKIMWYYWLYGLLVSCGIFFLLKTPSYEDFRMFHYFLLVSEDAL